MPIRVLDPQVALKIAAGEVVERPSSVVKELLENALDAGASHVTVEVEGGGVALIRVSDNGNGIPGDELELAFHRHATSKIGQLSDLDRVDTLGFRGEALPSIAAVARVSLSSRPQGCDVGQQIELRWGNVTGKGPHGGPPGTIVTVADLFENVPARRKFLRTASAETSRVSDLVSRFALAFPEVQFRLRIDGRETLLSPGNQSLADTLAAVYRVDVAQGLLEASWELTGEGYSAKGYISSPSLHRANRSYITFLVNRRWVQSRLLSYALEEAYQGFLPQRRYPVAVLNIEVPANEVDVNVHPAKREVRFRQENKVFTVVQRAVRSSLVAISPVPEMNFPGAHASFQNPPLPFSFLPADPFATAASPPVPSGAGGREGTGVKTPYLRVVGQVQNTYLVAESPQGVYLLDQHAAHERVLFEQISRVLGDTASQARPLLQPESVELSPAQEEMVRANWELLERYGFLLEPFGDRTYLVRGIPAVASSADPSQALREVLDLMSSQGMLKDQEEALAASIACHSAVRAGMALTTREMEELIVQLEGATNPHTCPHGRPTMIHLSAHHLEREFGRR